MSFLHGPTRKLRRLATLAEMQGRHLLRRRLALVMLAAMPAAFYLAVAGEKVPPGEDPWPLGVGGIGVAWAVAGASFFLALSARRVDERLLLAGYRPTELLAGRLLFLEGLAVPIVLGYSGLLVAMSSAAVAPLTLAVALTGLIGVALGLAIASLLPRELEGTLALIAVIGVEMTVHGGTALAPFLPFYGPIKLIGISWTGGGSVMPLVAHAVLYMAGFLVLAVVLWSRTTVAHSQGPGAAAGGDGRHQTFGRR